MTTPPTEPTVTCVDGLWRGDWSDGYRLTIQQLDATRVGVYKTKLEVRYKKAKPFTTAVDLLDDHSKNTFAAKMAGKNGVGPLAWSDRLDCFYTELQEAKQHHTDALPWGQALTVDELLSQTDEDLPAMVRDMVMPGGITLISAHRGAGKTIVLSYLAIALARGGIFRGDRLHHKRVFLVDRDNPAGLVRRRFRDFGGQGTTQLRILTRDKAPTLTEKDRDIWAQFPVEDYDVVVIDSISAATEGISEKEGKQTQEWLAILKDLAMRGPAVIGLANTDKAGTNIRGRGEITNAVDIVYECRNITGWTPSHGGDWVAELPERGEHTWQEAAVQRRGAGAKMQIAFVATKFRFGEDPEPFVLEIDTSTTPWTLGDITETLARAGETAAQESAAAARREVEYAAETLVRAIASRTPDSPLLKTEAETILMDCNLSRTVARTLLATGGNNDIYPSGQWVIREVPNHPTGKALGVYLVRGDDFGKRYSGNSSASNHAKKQTQAAADGLPGSGERFYPHMYAETQGESQLDLSPARESSLAGGGISQVKEQRHDIDAADLSPEKRQSRGKNATSWCPVHRSVELISSTTGMICPLCQAVAARS